MAPGRRGRKRAAEECDDLVIVDDEFSDDDQDSNIDDDDRRGQEGKDNEDNDDDDDDGSVDGRRHAAGSAVKKPGDRRGMVRDKAKYAPGLWKLSDALQPERSSADFFVCDAVDEFALPGLQVHGLGPVALPMTEPQVQQVISKCSQAPFGRGERTFVDTNVRNTWQLSPDAFSLTNPGWKNTVDAMAAKCKTKLGIHQSFSAHLYKLLIYEEGGKFEAHRDSEKEPGMFGTLVIVLPCAFEGGDLIVRHAGEERRFDPSTMNAMALRFAGFYADCQHEVLPVTTGYRVCLTYNLVATRGEVPQPLSGNVGVEQLLQAIRAFFRDDYRDERPTRRPRWGGWAPVIPDSDSESDCEVDLTHFAHVLEHRYTANGLCFDLLKGKDRTTAELLRQACMSSEGEFALYLSHMTFHSKIWEGMEDEDAVQRLHTDGDCVPVVSTLQGAKSMEITQRFDVTLQVLPVGTFEGLDFDEEEEEPTGNEGTRYTNWYNTAALIVLPRREELRCQVEKMVPSEVLAKFLETVEAKDPMAIVHGNVFIDKIETSAVPAKDLRKFFKAVGDLSDWSISTRCMDLLGSLGDAVDVLLLTLISESWERCGNQVVMAIKKLPKWKDRMRLLGTVQQNVTDQHIIDQWGKQMVEAMFPRSPGLRRFGSIYTSLQGSNVTDGPISASQMNEMLNIVLQMAPSEFVAALNIDVSLERIVAPGLQALIQVNGAVTPTIKTGIQNVISRLELLLAPPTRALSTKMLTCKCNDCEPVRAFLASPTESSYSFAATQSRRQHVERSMMDFRTTVGLTTNRTTQPQTLVLTKLDASFEERRLAIGKVKKMIMDLRKKL